MRLFLWFSNTVIDQFLPMWSLRFTKEIEMSHDFLDQYFLDTKWIGTNWKLFNRKQKCWFLFDSWKWSIRKLFFCYYKNSSIFESCPWKQKMVFPTFRIFNLCMGTTLVFSSSDDSSCHVSKKMSNIWSNIELNKVIKENQMSITLIFHATMHLVRISTFFKRVNLMMQSPINLIRKQQAWNFVSSLDRE